MNVKILGSGCPRCQKVMENAKIALKELNVEAEVEHVKDFGTIMDYGVMSTPALVVDEKLIAQGKLLTVEQLKNIFSAN